MYCTIEQIRKLLFGHFLYVLFRVYKDTLHECTCNGRMHITTIIYFVNVRVSLVITIVSRLYIDKRMHTCSSRPKPEI